MDVRLYNWCGRNGIGITGMTRGVFTVWKSTSPKKKKKKFPKRRRTSAPSKPPRGDLMDLNFARTRTSARTRITCENQRRLYEPAYSVRRRRRCHVSVIYWDRKLRLGPVGFGHGCRCLPARVVYGRLYLCRGPDCVRTKYNRVHEHATALSTQRTRRVTYESFKRTKADGGGGGVTP